MTHYTTNGRAKEYTPRWPTGFRFAAAVVKLVLCALFTVVAAEAAGPSDEVRLVFVGDVMIGRWIGELIDKYGSEYPLQPAHPFLREADIAFGNLESPLTTAPYIRNGYNLVANPAHVSSLTLAGFDVMGLGNNHITDHGPAGITETVRTLEEVGIAYLGAGTTITEAHRSWIGEISSVRVAYLAYDSTWGSVPATESRAGSAHPDDRVVADISRARQEADLVVVSVHWGQEYKSLPNKQQRGYARMLAKAGADIIVGHHPHVVQPLEWLLVPGRDSPTLVAYSLGNFIFDQEFSEETSESAILSCQVGPAGVQNARLIPVHIRQGQARPVSSRQGEKVLSRLLPRDKASPPYKMFSAVTLPTGESDFQTAWWVTPDDPPTLPPLTTDVDGNGQSEALALSDHRVCVLTVEGATLWCTPPQWQIWAGALDDVDGDGLAELITVGQQNEEVAPAVGGLVQVWEWLDGEFRLLWRSLPGDYRRLWLADMDGDGGRDIGVNEGS